MTAKEKKNIADQKLIERAIAMYEFTHGKKPSGNWCTNADRAKFLISYYKDQYNILG